MQLLTHIDLQALIHREDGICVSIYLPANHHGSDARQNVIRLKNLFKQASDKLQLTGLNQIEARNLLQPAERFLKLRLWNHSESLVLFISSEGIECYSLPIVVKEQIMVGKHFLITPVLSLFPSNGKFFILALSQKQLRLLHCTMNTYHEEQLRGVPRSLKEAMQFMKSERVIQFHTQTPHVPGARAAAIIHGHGVGIDDEKTYLQEYFRLIDTGLHQIFRLVDDPLVVAAVDSLHSTYRKMNTYPHLCEKGIKGNPDLMRDSELHERAKSIMHPIFDKKKEEAISLYFELQGTRQASNNAEDILRAAEAGQVRYLFLQPDNSRWGNYEAGMLASHEKPDAADEDIFNLAAILTIRNGGNVYCTEPDTTKPSIFAVFRYSRQEGFLSLK